MKNDTQQPADPCREAIRNVLADCDGFHTASLPGHAEQILLKALGTPNPMPALVEALALAVIAMDQATDQLNALGESSPTGLAGEKAQAALKLAKGER